jgi:diacylglycerol kinase (ATP)
VALVAESRLETKIHSPLEVLAGGLLGFFITLFIFQIMI